MPKFKKNPSPFRMKSGNSPLKETEDWFNVRGYLKGEQGLVPDWKGQSTTETATKVSQSIQKSHGKVKQVVKNMLSPKTTKKKKQETKNGGEFKKGTFAPNPEKINMRRMTKKGPEKLKVNIPDERHIITKSPRVNNPNI